MSKEDLSLDRIDAMRAFVAVAREQSFTAAGHRLGISVKQVSKRVAHLEAALSVQLFNRTTRSVALTDLGEALLIRSRPLLDQFDEMEAVLSERQTALAGPIKITAPTVFGSTHLVRALGVFMRAHPNVTVDLKLSDTRVAVVEEGFDLAIRIGSLRDSSMIAKRIAPMPMVVCAAPGYLAEHGRPGHPTELISHNCLIDDDRIEAAGWPFMVEGREITVKVSGGFHADSPRAIAEMAMSGYGIGRCPLYMAADVLDTGRLIRLFEACETHDSILHALYPPNRHLTARVRGLLDHLALIFAP